MAKIINVKGRQVFDSRGNPTVEAEIFLDNDISASAISPSGASTGAGGGGNAGIFGLNIEPIIIL